MILCEIRAYMARKIRFNTELVFFFLAFLTKISKYFKLSVLEKEAKNDFKTVLAFLFCM